jgi:hypothetical protein
MKTAPSSITMYRKGAACLGCSAAGLLYLLDVIPAADWAGEQQVGGSGLHCVMPLPHGRGLWAWQQRSWLMAILNVTPDSFSDGGEFFSPDAAVAKAESLVQEGADIIDVGGQSSRPGALRLSPEEELTRVIPVIECVRLPSLILPPQSQISSNLLVFKDVIIRHIIGH